MSLKTCTLGCCIALLAACAPERLEPEAGVADRVERVVARDRAAADWPSGYRIDCSEGPAYSGPSHLSSLTLRTDVTLSNGEHHRSGSACNLSQSGSDLTLVCSNLVYYGTISSGRIELNTTQLGGRIRLVGALSSSTGACGTVEGRWEKQNVSISSGMWEMVTR